MSTTATAFYAYPSKPPDRAETIQGAITEISQAGVVDMIGWPSVSVTGKLIIREILDAIDRAAIFACDLTDLNDNVLFELGYAIGRSKRIWISLNSTIESATANYRRFGTALIPIGYSGYSNQRTLVEAFYKDQPWEDIASGAISIAVGDGQAPATKPTVLYLKSKVETDASVLLTEDVYRNDVFSEVVLDDPTEAASQPLAWYVQNIRHSDAVVAHLLSKEHAGAAMHNAKCSLVCGLAFGLAKPVLMLAHEPHVSPVDYQNILRAHTSKAQCARFFDSWLADVRARIEEHWSRVSEHHSARVGATDLKHLSIGEAIAENEEDDIGDYFIETNAYVQSLRGQQTIFVGRKGTGKTANLYAVENELAKNKRNHVCVIKPVGYEIEGVLRMLKQSIPASERGYLVESLWKFLVYTELAASVADELEARPDYLHSEFSAEERDLIGIVKERANLIRPPFSIRLQEAVESLCEIELYKPGGEQRARVSEILHNRMLANLRDLLSRVLQGRDRVAILVDNLDKAWGPSDDIERLVQLLFGLLAVSGRIVDEFQVSSGRREKVNLSMSIFLRSDIFAHVQESARERDKLVYEPLIWNDPALLLRVIDERLSSSVESLTPDEIWERFFVPEVENLPIRQFIVQNTLPRPRDVIYLVKTAVADAVNRAHARVEETDFISAREKYSQFVLDALIAEDDPRLGKLEEIFYEFPGSAAVLTRAEVEENIKNAGVDDDKVPMYLDMLCDLNFLGIGSSTSTYEYPQDERSRRISQKVAQKVAGRRGDGQEMYEVHPAFHPVLQIQRGA